MGRPCIFLDRDGIVNVPPDPARYVTRLEEFRILPGFLETLRVVSGKGYAAVIVTNQRGVATGYMTQEELNRIHDALRSVLVAQGLEVLDILTCTADNDGHPWRKPNPGMLLEAARRHGLDLARSWMVGDSESDVEAGRRAGCRTVRVAPAGAATRADVHLVDMTVAAPFFAARLDRVCPGDEEVPP